MNPSNPADDSDFTYDTVSEADQGYARALGAERTDRAWILSDRDCWYPNPYYTGLPVPHPEDYDPECHGDDYAQYLANYRAALAAPPVVEPVEAEADRAARLARENDPNDPAYCPF